jgi:undecaprenyl-diphosphatase
MNIFQSILLGIIQGITEFLPISSSAHLVIVPYLLNWHIPADQAFVFDVLVQIATLLGVLAYFWRDLLVMTKAFFVSIRNKAPFATAESRLAWFLLIATVPAGFLGLLIKDLVEATFNSPATTAIFLFVTAGMLTIAEWLGKRTRSLEVMDWKDALWVGCFQAIAIFPGISRSGATMTGGMTRNFNRTDAARFSFLLSIPIMLAAGALTSVDLLQLPNLNTILPIFIPGFIISGVVGYIAIRWLLRFLVNHSLYDFAIYCVAAGLITLITSAIRR